MSIAPTGVAHARQDIDVDVSGYATECGVAVRVHDGVLHVAWTMAESKFGRVVFNLRPGRPLIRSLRIASKPGETILEGVVPVTFVTVTRAHDSEPCFTSSGHFSYYVDRAVAG